MVTSQSIIPDENNRIDILNFFIESKSRIQRIIEEVIQHRGVKYYLTLKIGFIKFDKDGERVRGEPIFHSKIYTIVNTEEVDLNTDFTDIELKTQQYLKEGSGWTMNYIIELQVNTAPYKPLKAKSYIPTPAYIANKKAVINIQNTDNKCFLWSILAAIHPVINNPQRVSHYRKYETELYLSDIDYPVSLDKIHTFEKRNNISVNVIGYKEFTLFPLYMSQHRSERKVNLLLISSDEVNHYCLIKDMSRLLGDRTKYKNAYHYCHYCFHGFVRQDLLDEHQSHCERLGAQKIEMADANNKYISFYQHQRKLRVPFIVYADFESFTCKMDGCENEPQTSFTCKYQKHEPCSYSYMIISNNPEFSKGPISYRGSNVIDHFIDALLIEDEQINDILSNVVDMELTEEENNFTSAIHCHICDNMLGTDRVRDHCHLTGKFRGAAHNRCNLNFKYQREQGKFFMMNNEQLHFICELALNILAGTITIPDKLKVRLMPHKSFLRKLANRKISNRLKKILLFRYARVLQLILPIFFKK